MTSDPIVGASDGAPAPPSVLDRIVLGATVAPGVETRAPVRIFVGTEHAQYRAERVFVWSIEQLRDPRRAYEIVLMKDLPGFDRRRWLTGFTNYRFAVSALVGGEGRAIYNDIDQIYLADPAELFDRDMQGHGFLSINERDTSVMLIDCGRMRSVWTEDLAQSARRKAIEARAVAVPGLWGRLPGAWNARDEEYAADRSKLLHFTTIHTQPWMPFPQRFVYQRNPVAKVWHALERSADEAGFELFAEERPSAAHRALLEELRSETCEPLVASAEERADRERTLEAFRPASVLERGIGALHPQDVPLPVGAAAVTRYDPAVEGFEKGPREGFDAVVSAGGLERLADEDVPWAVEELFRFARRLLYVWIGEDARAGAGEAWRSGVPRDRFWWSRHFEAAGARHPEVHWKLVAHLGRGDERRIDWLRGRGQRPGELPRVWVLADDKPGHTAQSTGLAESLGWPWELRQLRFNGLNRLSNRLRGASTLGLDRSRSDSLEPPWPDLVIAAGRKAAPVARWVAQRSRGHTRLVQLGRKGADTPEGFDLAVTCAHFQLLPHPRRIETVAPIHGITHASLAAAEEAFREIYSDRDGGFVALLVGGSSARHCLDAETARRMGREVSAFAHAARCSVVAITSPRTGEESSDALASALDERAFLYRWRGDDPGNPYLGALALADAVVVTGDSESMLGEAAALGKPLYIYPVPERSPSLRQRLAEGILAAAHARPRKRGKGSVRPQQGLEALCSRLLAGGWVKIPRDVGSLHQGLVEHGAARRFGVPFEVWRPAPVREVEMVARRVRVLFGQPEPCPVTERRADEHPS